MVNSISGYTDSSLTVPGISKTSLDGLFHVQTKLNYSCSKYDAATTVYSLVKYPTPVYLKLHFISDAFFHLETVPLSCLGYTSYILIQL